jgi:methylated-DNA-[protein]-cysteine S-methyltransferase
MKHAMERVASPVGELLMVAGDAGLRALVWADEGDGRVALPEVTVASHPTIDLARRQLEEYFSGRRRAFDVPLDPIGTPFQLRVWQALREIPFGETRSYQQQAESIGNAAAVRAVGGANGRNPISIIVPCHRVIGKGGSLTGFGGGLRHEGAMR